MLVCGGVWMGFWCLQVKCIERVGVIGVLEGVSSF